MKRTDPYSGPFPRKRHSHRCKGCEAKFYQLNPVACYKQHCTKPQLLRTCSWCKAAIEPEEACLPTAVVTSAMRFSNGTASWGAGAQAQSAKKKDDEEEKR
jgi:hypothetical protein